MRVAACLCGLGWALIMASQAAIAAPDVKSPLGAEVVERVVQALVKQHGSDSAARARRGVAQVAERWREGDGSADDFAAFCATHFLADPQQLDVAFARFERNLEQIRGHFVEVVRYVKEPMDLDREPMLPIDLLFATFAPESHLYEDLFTTKAAFVALLNFAVPTPDDILSAGPRWNRRQWAEARLLRRFAHRVPAEVEQRAIAALVRADDYINRYNFHLDHIVGADGQRLYPDSKRLISHWGLRDELKAQYAQPDGLARQRLIYQVMGRIVRQELPAIVIDNPAVDWDVENNVLLAPAGASPVPAEREPDTRYARWLDVFQALRGIDPYYPDAPSHVARRFKIDRELSEAEVKGLLEAVLTAPVGKRVAKLIRKRLGRPLQPFDIWYDGFKVRSTLDEAELDRKVRARYPNLAAFQEGLPALLGQLGFVPDTAAFLAARIAVDPARGAGHAWGAERREDKAHLRTRVPAAGMDYKGFNIAMHELGHTVEQVFSLHRIDPTSLAGVPNTAFTEGFAFVFQGRDLDVLGVTPPPQAEHLKALDVYWATAEIAGVALVDMAAWNWLYAHPQATPAQFREAVLSIAVDTWNRYFAPLIGVVDSDVLAIYSHAISGALYLPDYPLGHIIAFQVEEHMKTRDLASEMERMCRLGALSPQAWMQAAVGASISAAPLIQAAERAAKAL